MRIFLKKYFILMVSAGLILAISGSAFAKSVKGSHLVVIDPAHGGDEKGVQITEEIYEKDLTLAIARRLQKNLDGTGNLKVQLTRHDDRKVSIAERIKFAGDSKADLFISIHINAGFERKASGFEVYFQGFKSYAAGQAESGEIVKDMVRTQYLNESVRFANILLRKMERVFPRKDRGLREAPIRVIQGLTIPSVVLEAGFATQAKERKALLEPSTQKSIAEAIGSSVKEYF